MAHDCEHTYLLYPSGITTIVHQRIKVILKKSMGQR